MASKQAVLHCWRGEQSQRREFGEKRISRTHLLSGSPAESFASGRTRVPAAQPASEVPASHLPPGHVAAEHARCGASGESGCSVGTDVPRSAPSPQAGAACGASPHHEAPLIRAALREKPSPGTSPHSRRGREDTVPLELTSFLLSAKQVQDAFSVIILDVCIEHYSL